MSVIQRLYDRESNVTMSPWRAFTTRQATLPGDSDGQLQ